MKFGARTGIALATGLALAASLSWAAPDEEVLGKSQGYPVCPFSSGLAQSCMVGQWSRMDEVLPARKVAKGAETWELKRPASAPELGVEQFLERHRNTGLLIAKGDTILVERYQYERGPEHRFHSASMGKTVVAMLVGIALDEGAIKSIDDKAVRYVPQLKGHPYGDTSLRHLLTMSSGVEFNAAYDSVGDEAILRRIMFAGPGGVEAVKPFNKRVRPAGERFNYASAETQVLALVLRAAVGKPLAEYLSEKVWQPMGAEADATWIIDKAGFETGPGGVNATLRDWGRFGLLLANDGALNGKRIIPAHWVRSATTPEAPHLRVGAFEKFRGYGYQTWILNEQYRHFALLGVRGQAIIVAPYLKLVVVHTGVDEKEADSAALRDRVIFFYDALKKLNQT